MSVYVNVYELDRAYGGPEEGGWWYDIGTFEAGMSLTLPGTADAAVVRQLADLLLLLLDASAQAEGTPPVGYSNYRGGRYGVRVEDSPGRDWPASTPRYE